MAKTFKNLPPTAAPAAAKPASERDFFDLSDDLAPTKNLAYVPETPPKASKPGGFNNTRNTGNTALLASPAPEPATPPEGVRQTFVLGSSHLEQLRDYVHARRAQGDYAYSQRQALQEALELLFAGATPAPPRPAQVREQEQAHRQRIRQGRQARAGA